MTEGAVKMAASRLRKRYGEILREEIARPVADPTDVEDEIRDLFAALARGIRADSCDLGGDFPFSCVEDDDEGSSRIRGGLRHET